MDFSSKQIIKMLTEEGWFLDEIRGSHHQFKHSEIKGKVTIPHPKKSIPIKTALAILKQAGIKFNK